MSNLVKPLVRLLDRHAAPLAMKLRAAKHLREGEPELRLVPSLIESDEAAFDVGANNGVYTAIMARSARSVLTFEPNPELAARLRRSFPRHVHVEECALSDSQGEAELAIPVDGSHEFTGLASIEPTAMLKAEQVRRIKVPLRRLDDFADVRVAFVKIDVEGHELAVLRGGDKLIAAHAPTFLVEAEERHRPDAVGSVMRFFADRTYEGFFLRDGSVRPISELGAAAADHDLPGDQPYINNFIFVKRPAVRARLGV